MSSERDASMTWKPGGYVVYDANDRQGVASLAAFTNKATTSLFGHSRAWSTTARVISVWRRMSASSSCRHIGGVQLLEKRVSRELVVYVDSTTWMYELNMRRDELLQEWNFLCGEENADLRVNSLSFKLSSAGRSRGHVAALANYGEQRALPPVPLNPEERAWVEERVCKIPDENLREHARRAMIATLEWKKSKA